MHTHTRFVPSQLRHTDDIRVQVETTGAIEKLSLQGRAPLVAEMRDKGSLQAFGATLVSASSNRSPEHKKLHANINRIVAALVPTELQDEVAEFILPALVVTAATFGDATDIMWVRRASLP